MISSSPWLRCIACSTSMHTYKPLLVHRNLWRRWPLSCRYAWLWSFPMQFYDFFLYTLLGRWLYTAGMRESTSKLRSPHQLMTSFHPYYIQIKFLGWKHTYDLRLVIPVPFPSLSKTFSLTGEYTWGEGVEVSFFAFLKAIRSISVMRLSLGNTVGVWFTEVPLPHLVWGLIL